MDKIDIIFNSFQPEMINQKVGYDLDLAKKNFLGSLNNIIIKSEREFADTVGSYYNHLNRRFLRTNVDLPESLRFSFTREFLDKIHKGGYIEACRSVLLGSSLMQIIEEMTNAFREQAVQKYYSHILNDQIPSLDYEERIRLTELLLNKFQKFLPDNYRYENPAILSTKLEQLMITICQNLNNINNSLRHVWFL